MKKEMNLSEIEVLFADIDDTISTDGKITADAYSVLWKAYSRGLRVVPVTGRPAGWCDHIARMWPVDGVIGENGGLYFRMEKDGMRRFYVQDENTREENRKKLLKVKKEIIDEVKGCAIASDQQYREFDLAIDFCEDVDPLKKEDIRRIVDIFERNGAVAKVSSIHVNGWFGNFDKLSMAHLYVEEIDKRELKNNMNKYAFIGDSPNDEPMFSYFPISFGVANVMRFIDDMKSRPAIICHEAGGAGFVEAVESILRSR